MMTVIMISIVSGGSFFPRPPDLHIPSLSKVIWRDWVQFSKLSCPEFSREIMIPMMGRRFQGTDVAMDCFKAFLYRTPWLYRQFQGFFRFWCSTNSGNVNVHKTAIKNHGHVDKLEKCEENIINKILERFPRSFWGFMLCTVYWVYCRIAPKIAISMGRVMMKHWFERRILDQLQCLIFCHPLF